jgi:methionine-rich copper-binding protein CopC
MNGTKKLAALLVACIMVAAVGVPIVNGDTPTMTAGVDNEPPVVGGIAIDPDPANPGDKVTVKGTLSDPNAVKLKDEIDTFSYVVTKPDGDVYTKGDIKVDATWDFKFDLGEALEVPAGTWTVEVTATDNDGLLGTGKGTFEVNTMMMYKIDFGAGVAYGTVIIDEKKTVKGDADMATAENPTIENLGNVVMDVTISAKNLEAGKAIIENKYIGAAVGGAKEQSLEEERTFDVDIKPDDTAKIDYTLTAPVGTQPGNYIGETTVTGIAG